MPEGKLNKEHISRYSAENMTFLRKGVGEAAASYAQKWAQGQSLTLSAFHETKPENLSAIVKSGKICSLESLRAQKQSFARGMSYEESGLDEMFKSVAHKADELQDYVYLRPHINGLQKDPRRPGALKDGVFAPSLKEEALAESWFSFRDGNQLTGDDYHMMGLGFTVTKGFDQSDVYETKDMAEAIALKAVRRLKNISHVAAARRYIYEKELEAYQENPEKYIAPDEDDSMSFEEYYDMIKDFQSDYLDFQLLDAIDGPRARYLLKDTPFGGGKGIPPLTDQDLKSPEFAQAFNHACQKIVKEVAIDGQLAVANELPLADDTVIYEKGEAMPMRDYQAKHIPAAPSSLPAFKAPTADA